MFCCVVLFYVTRSLTLLFLMSCWHGWMRRAEVYKINEMTSCVMCLFGTVAYVVVLQVL